MLHPLDAPNERLLKAVESLDKLPSLRRGVDDHVSIHDHFGAWLQTPGFRVLEESLNASRVYYDAHDGDLRDIVGYVKGKMFTTAG